MQSIFDAMFQDFFNVKRNVKWMPGEKSIQIELPGFNEENLSVSVKGNTLKITGYTDDGRTLNLKYQLNDKVPTKAGIKDGILTITFDDISEKEIELL